MHEDTTFDAPGVGGGISRRDMLRKSAVVGGAGALMWAAPSITKYGSAAFGDTDGTPLGKELSYVAIQYDCNAVPEDDPAWDPALAGALKFELEDGPALKKCEELPAGKSDHQGVPGCRSVFDPEFGDGGYLSCTNFSVSFPNNDLYTVQVCLVPNGTDGCIVTGAGVGMCGSGVDLGPEEVGDCVAGVVSGDQRCVTFSLCDA